MPPSNKRPTRITKNVINAAAFNRINTVSLKTKTSSESRRANRRDENCDGILSFVLSNDVMFKNLMTQLICLIALNILLN